ncbi:MAG TPA: peptidoglycan editing factor PgeF [Acidobacteriaceae bacterium]|nr:peptidoglycan editing factor PgeF [Acidobacteriaceae bacterium]
MASPRSVSPDLKRIDKLLRGGGLTPRRKRSQSGWSGNSRQSERKEILPQPARRVVKSRVEIVRAGGWDAWPWLVQGFSTRTGGATTAYRPGQRAGELNLGFTQTDTREHVLENRRRFLEALGAPKMKVVTLKQIHSSMVKRAGIDDADRDAPCYGDGLMTNEPGVLLAIQTADCIPVLVADVKRRAVAAFHAGWRGTLQRIVENGVGRMRSEFNSQPEDLIAAIGPGIAACCYAVGEEVRSEFASQFAYAPELLTEVSDADPIHDKYPLLFLTARAPGHSNLGPQIHLDLMEANRRQLLDAGLRAGSIAVIGHCTRCQNNRYFSYRAEQGFTGRLLSVVGVRAASKR